MPSMSITWDLVATGLARIEISDERATTVLDAATTSYAPEDLLDAVYDMVCCGEDGWRFVFEHLLLLTRGCSGEPVVRWRSGF